jgi:hypothetical protein
MNRNRFRLLVNRQPLQHHVVQKFGDVVELERDGFLALS